jgi:hypothetical protein
MESGVLQRLFVMISNFFKESQRKKSGWNTIQLSKEERRNKLPEEQQAIRKAKWDALHPETQKKKES